MTPCIVLIDPFHPYARRLVDAAYREWGVRTVALVTSTREYLRNRGAPGVLGSPAVEAYYHVPTDQVPTLGPRLAQRHDVRAVVPYHEFHVVPAALLSRSLGLPGMDPAVLGRFRDKFALKEHIRSRPGAPRMNASRLVRDPAQVRAALTDDAYRRFVLKPNSGTGNNRIGLFDADVADDALIAYFATTGSDAVVMEAFLDGTEYCVNGQVTPEGSTTTLSVFRTHHLAANGRTNLASHFELVRHDDPVFARVADYAAAVLRAADLTASPFHMELIVDDDGPCLIEVAARLAGAGMAVDTGIAHGGALDVFTLALQGYTGLAPLTEQRVDWVAYDSRAMQTVCGVSTTRERVVSLSGVAAVEALPEFLRWVYRPRVGRVVEPTADLGTIPWQVTLVGSDQDHLDDVAQRVRATLSWNRPTGALRHGLDVAAEAAVRGRRAAEGVTRMATAPVGHLPHDRAAGARHDGAMALRRIAARVGYARPVRDTVESSATLTALSRRFVAGETRPDAVRAAATLAGSGFLSVLNPRGDAVRTEDEAAAQVDEFLGLVDDLADAGLAPRTEVSVKLEQMGLKAPGGPDLAMANVQRVCRSAAERGIAVTVDMESEDEVPVTLEVAAALRAEHPDVGVAVQAYLVRTQSDCRALAREGARVRLCKGGYHAQGPGAFGRRRDVDLSYVRCLHVLVDGGARPLVATHDPRLVKVAQALAARAQRSPDLEFQMLMGIRTAEQRRLRDQGLPLRVYVPYGPQWYPWFVHRIVERPSSLRLALSRD